MKLVPEHKKKTKKSAQFGKTAVKIMVSSDDSGNKYLWG